MSKTIFDQYLKRLDPGKSLFTLKDINLLDKYQFIFDNDLKRGRLNSGFQIFNLYMQRSKQRLEYILELIKTWEKELDFTKKESIVTEYDQRNRKADTKDLFPLWKKELKNHIISLILSSKDDDKDKDSEECKESWRLALKEQQRNLETLGEVIDSHRRTAAQLLKQLD